MTRKSLQLFAPLPQGGIDPQTPHTDLPVTCAYSADVVKHEGGAFHRFTLSITREGALLKLDSDSSVLDAENLWNLILITHYWRTL